MEEFDGLCDRRMMQVEIQYLLQRRDGSRLRLSDVELDGKVQSIGHLHRFEECRQYGNRHSDWMFVEQPGMPVEQGKFGLRGAHDQFYRHAIAPVG